MQEYTVEKRQPLQQIVGGGNAGFFTPHATRGAPIHKLLKIGRAKATVPVI